MEASAISVGARLGRPGAARLLALRSDDQLVSLFRLGNEEAFAVIHDRYRARLLAYTRQMLSGSQADAEDALQDVYLRAYRALRADGRPVTLRAWLYRVAHNRCVDQLRRAASKELELPDNVRSLHGPGADPGAEVERREDLRRLVADVGRLPSQQRSALLMREMEGLSYQELADALDTSVGSVKSLLVRARVSLVEAQEARDTTCVTIRDDLLGSHGRGVRSSGLARRHLRECAGCRDYGTALKGLRRELGAFAPSHGPFYGLLKLLGIGGAGSGAAAGTGAAAGGGAAATAGGTLAAGGGVAVTKVAAAVCCAALVGGGAVEVSHDARPAPRPAPLRTAAGPTTASPAPLLAAAVRRIEPAAAVPAHATAPPAAPAKPAEAVAVAKPDHAVVAEVESADALPEVATDATAGFAAAADEETVAAATRAGGLLAPDDDEPADAPPAATDAPAEGVGAPATAAPPVTAAAAPAQATPPR